MSLCTTGGYKFMTQSEKVRHPWRAWCDASFQPHHPSQIYPSSWGAHIVTPDGLFLEKAGIMHHCTASADAELWAILHALQVIPDGASVMVLSDCQGVVEGVQDLLSLPPPKLDSLPCHTGVSAFFHKQPAALQQLRIEQTRLRHILVQWVKGHHDDFGNCRAHWLAHNQLTTHKIPFQYPAMTVSSNSLPGASPGKFWKTYVPFVQGYLTEHRYQVRKGDAIRMTKDLCVFGVLDAATPYGKNQTTKNIPAALVSDLALTMGMGKS